MPHPYGIILYSTMFKTVQDLTTGKTRITSSVSLGSMFNGGFFKPQSIVSEEDIKALEAYNTQVNNGVDANNAFDSTMKNASQTAQNLAKSANGAAVDINAIPKASKAAAVGMKALSVASNMLISMGIAFAITKIIEGFQWLTSISERAIEKAREAAQATTEQAKESSNSAEELLKLKRQLDDDTVSAENLTEAFRKQTKNMPELSEDIRNLTGDYKDLSSAIDAASTSALENARDDAVANVNATRKLIEKSAYRYHGGAITGDRKMFFIQTVESSAFDEDDFGEETERLQKILEDNAKFDSEGVESLFIGYVPKSSNAEDIYAYYQSLVQIRDEIEGFANGDVDSEVFDTILYKRVSDGIKYFEEDVKVYEDAIQRLHEANAQLALSEYLKTNDIKTKEDFDTYIQGIKDGTIRMTDGQEASEGYKQVLIDIVNSAFPQFSSAAKTATENTNGMTVSLESLNAASESISVLSKAFKELSDDGYITIQTLDDIRKATDLSEEAWKEYQDKLITAKVGSDEFNRILSDLTYKMLANKFATSKLTEVTEEEISAILRENGVIADTSLLMGMLRLEKALLNKEEIDTSSEVEQILNLANSANVSAASIKKLTRALEFLKKAEKSDAAGEHRMAEYYRNQAQVYLDMPVEYDEVSFGRIEYTNGSSSSKTNEALDNYLKDAENRYKIHQDENKYIQDLQYAYDNLTKDEKERLDITSKINEAYRDLADNRIKDIKHEIDLVKELHGDDFDVTAYYDQIQNVAHEEANRLRSMGYDDNSNEIQSLQKTWWDAENSKLDFYIKQRESVIRDIEHARDMALKQNPNLDTASYYRQMQDEYHRQAEYYRSIDAEKYKAKIQELQDAWWDAEEAIIENRKNAIEKSLSDIDDYIDARNHYNNWNDSKVSEVEAIKLQCALLDEAYRLNLISLEEYTEKSAQYTQKLYTVARENIIETISELVEDYEEMRQFESSQLESQKTLLQSYYDVSNAIVEAQHEIDKELKASQSMHEYLNEDTRELLFNQEDYNALNEELLEIQTAADELQKQYQKDILNANAETIAEITSQYQMQYETMMKQYEIAKAELEVAKKRQKLDNVLAERNTRMFINGQWQWVAKTQDVIDAQNELAEAEMEKQKQEASLEQTEAVNKLTEQINAIETDLNKVRKYWTDMQDLLNGNSEEFAKALREISRVSSPELKRIIEASGGDVKSFSESLSESTNTLAGIISTDLSNMSTGIDNLITDLQNYSATIQLLIDQINGTTSSGRILKVGADGNAPSGATIGDTIVTAGGNYKIVPANTPGATYNPASGHWSVKVNNSSGNNSSNSSGSGKTVQVGSNGNAPAGTKVGDVVKTSGGDYLVVAPNTKGASYNPVSGLWSIKVKEKDADGTRYTSGGLTLMGEDGFEAFISNNGRFIPINQPTIGNVGAGGVVFNREQMANLRNLWDLSNLGKISPFVSSSNTNKQSTVIDNSIHINGLTVGEQGNEDWINGLRRYVATHK